MSSVLDTAIIVGKEATYGTAAVGTRGYEGKADTWKREQEFLESTGFYAGRQAKRADRRVAINMGGGGSLELDVLNKGFGLVLQAMLGSVEGPTQIAATDAYTITAATTADDPADSFTVQTLRTDMSGAERAFTHEGAVMTSWSLSQEVGGFLVASMEFDFEDVQTATAAGTVSYPAATAPFDWTQVAVTIAGSPVDVMSFELNGDLALKTDRRFLRGSHLKKMPVRSGVPQFTGSMDMEFEDLTQYEAFVAGDPVAVVITYTGAAIDGENYEIVITLPAVQFTGESPEASLSDVPKQSIPFEVLWDGSAAAITITYTSTDTAL